MCSAAFLQLSAFIAQFVFTDAFRQKRPDVAESGFSDVCQRFPGQEGLVGGYDDVGHGDQPRQGIVLHDVPGKIMEENAVKPLKSVVLKLE